MIRPTPLFRVAGAAACALALSGCISLLPKTKPAHLYRFGDRPSAEAPAQRGGPSVGVFRSNSLFVREAAGDRLLAIVDGEAQYIAQTRWVAPATVLWDQAVLSAFDAGSGRVRLLSRGESGRAAYSLRLDVRKFEAQYPGGKDSAPTVEVEVRATLTRDTAATTALGPERFFRARVPSSSNNVSSIVSAYDQATNKVLGEIVTWTESQAAGAPS